MRMLAPHLLRQFNLLHVCVQWTFDRKRKPSLGFLTFVNMRSIVVNTPPADSILS